MTAKMAYSHQFHGGKTSMFSGDAEVTPDLHFRMSKKIAQLTKVIYSLKTKTDEHDSAIEQMKIEHNEKTQGLLQDTADKLEEYQKKIREQLQMQEKMEELEMNALEMDKHKLKALEEFNDFRLRAEHRETTLKSEHTEKLLSMSQEILLLKHKYEEEQKRLNELLNDAELDKIKACEDLEKKHRLDIDKVQNSFGNKITDADSKISILNDLHLREQQKLQEKIDQERLEFKKTIEDYELKLYKSQAFYEKEIAAVKASFESKVHSQVETASKDRELLSKEFKDERKALKERIDTLLLEIVSAEQETQGCRDEIQLQKSTIVEHVDTISSLNTQIANLRNSYSDIKIKLKEHEAELSMSKQTCEDQKDQLSSKSKLVIRLQTKEKDHVTKIAELQADLNEIQHRFAQLEHENQKLFGSNLSVQEKTSWEVQDLKKTMEDLRKDKKKTEDRLKKELTELELSSTRKQTEMHNEFTSSVVTLEKQYKGQIDMLKVSSAQDLDMLKKTLEQDMADRTQRYEFEYDDLKKDFDRMKNDLAAKLTATEAEVNRLNNTVENSEMGLGSATTHITSLKQLNENIKKQLEDITEKLKSSKVTEATLQSEIEKLNSLRAADRRKAELVLKAKLRELTEELDNKWMRQLAEDNERLHEELIGVKDAERQNALYDLRVMKQLELQEVQNEADKRINDLLQQISNGEIQKQNEIAALQKQWINKGMTETASEYANKMAAMDSQYREKIDLLNTDYKDQLTDLEKRLKEQHLTELQTQMIAHRAVVEGAKAEVERQRLLDISQLKTAHVAQMNDARSVLLDRHNTDIDRMNREYEQNIRQVREELQQAVDISKQKETESSSCIEDLRTELIHRDQHIGELTSSIDSLKHQQQELSTELNTRSQLINSVRNEANLEMQRRIDQSDENKRLELMRLQADHTYHIQSMVGEFGQVQEMFKDRIRQLNQLLTETDERFQKRESRPEDLEMIHKLRDTIVDKDNDIEHLKHEKKFYELELVNRETNFNKIFNSSQNKVSILHAAPPPKKKPEKAIVAVSPHSSNSSSRLEPLPGSPIHDEKINRIKPLPPPGLAVNKRYLKL